MRSFLRWDLTTRVKQCLSFVRETSGDQWRPVVKELIQASGYTALFDISTEAVLEDCAYRVGYSWGEGTYWFECQIQAAPEVGEKVTVAGLTCYQNM